VEFLLSSRQDEVLTLEGEVFKIGTGPKCEIRFDAEKDQGVLAHHCTILYERRKWYIIPEPGARVWLFEKEIRNKTRLENGAMLFFGEPFGPGLRVFGQAEFKVSRRTLAMLLERGGEEGRMVKAAARIVTEEMDKQRRGVRRALFRVKKREGKRLRLLLFAALMIVITGIAAFAYQAIKIRHFRTLAEEIFYSMKTLEVQIAQLELEGYDVSKRRSSLAELDKSYNQYAEEVTYGFSFRSYEDQIILRLARAFGECELQMPPEFAAQVKKYIRRWQSTDRWSNDIHRAFDNGYVDPIVYDMLQEFLPPQFFFIAMQESDFDVNRCGPRTRFGIAKGMWQFMPATALQYGLQIGPLAGVPVPDPRDERHDFKKSTQAAARYLKQIYSMEAQASGLLVLACYNYGDTRVRQLLRQMGENPRERNFWNLMRRFKLPKQTRDYVFYIFSAAVIAEDPKHFGFDVDNPLTGATERAMEKLAHRFEQPPAPPAPASDTTE